MIEIKNIDKLEIENEIKNEILNLSVEAQNYLKLFKWCRKIINGWLVKEWGYMLCVFYYEIEPLPESKADNFVWLIVGDLPPAYIDIQSATNEFEALNSYVFLMEDWINHVNKGKSVKDCFPINVKPTKKYATMLSNRINIIKEDMLPELSKIKKNN